MKARIKDVIVWAIVILGNAAIWYLWYHLGYMVGQLNTGCL